MRLKTILVVLMALMFLTTSLFTVAFGKSVLAKETKLAHDGESPQTTQATAEDSTLNQKELNKASDFSNAKTEENLAKAQSPNIFPSDSFVKNNSTDKTDMWRDFAKVDEDSAELVIGINSTQPGSYTKIRDLLVENGGKLVNTVSAEGEVIAVVADLPLDLVTSFAKDVQASNLARYIEPNMKYQTQFVPNDPYWGLQWGPQKIEADYAWNTTIGDPSVLVAVIDTGIDWDHLDLAANYVALGYDWVNNDTDPMDDFGHGTHVAGILAAVLNNSEGIAGIAQVSIMAEKGFDQYGYGYEDDLANAIIHAVNQGADVLSNSWGGYGESQLIYDAIKYAFDNGVLIIASAGNEAWDVKSYPAAYDEVVAVTATDEFDNPAWFTNFGDWVELAAPGVDIYSTISYIHDPRFTYPYDFLSGTSMAAPHVSGVAALIWSQFPNKTRDWVRLWLRYTADDLGDPGFDIYYGYGRINARKAVEETPLDHDVVVLNWQIPPYVEPSGLATINSTILNFGASDESNMTVELLVNGSIVDSVSIGFLASGVSATVSFSWSPMVEGAYNVTSYVVPVPGETVTENNVISAYIYVGFPLKVFVLDSAGTDLYTRTWEILNTNWYTFGDTLICIDYTTLNIDDITYADISATGADILIISCAYDWEFTDSEIDAITQYVYEGHGLIATAGTLYYQVPNNNKLAPLFGLNETVTWDATWTDLLHILNTTHPLFVNIPDPFVIKEVGTALPSDGRWDSNELIGGTFLALGHYWESAIVAYRGLVYISPWLEIIPAYYHLNLQLLFNAITWSSYQKSEHELVVSLDSPLLLEPGESSLLNATVINMGSNNETGVELFLLINGTAVNSTMIPELPTGESYTINYLWTTPPVEATYNVTAYAPPVPGENLTANNLYTKFTRVTYAVMIGIIETHGESLHTEELANYYTSLGHIVEKITTTITPGVLDNYDIIIVGEDWGDTPWLPSEIAAVEAFIDSGKGFVTIGDELATSVQEILGTYGISYTGISAPGGSSSYFDPLHPIMQGVSLIYAGSPVNSLQITAPAYWIANDISDTHILIAGAEVGGYVLGLSNDFAYYLYDDDNEIMFKNILDWMAVKYEHELAVSLEAPTFLEPGESTFLNATVHNRGLSNETDVELQLLINSTVVNSTTIPELLTGSSHTINYLWTPTVEATYNVTAYAPPVPGENVTANNIMSVFVNVQYLEVALFKNVDPWGYPANEEALSLYGIAYAVFSSSDFGLVDLSGYSKVVIASVQDQAFYNAMDAYRWWFEDYVSSGGVLEIHAAHYTGTGWVGTLPGGLQYVQNPQDYATIVDPTHPVVTTPNPITDAELDGWSASVHGYFGTYPADSRIVIVEDFTGYPAYLEFDYGAGVIVASSQTLEWAYWHRYSLILENSLLYSPIKYQHELAVTLQAPTFLQPSYSSLLNATVHNRGLSNETNVELFLLINGITVNNATIPELLTGSSYALSYLWTPTVAGTYNVTAYAPPIPDENVTANNIMSQMVYVRHVDVALISDHSELLAITSILDSMGIDYDIYNDNAIYLYTEDLNLLLNYPAVIFYTDYRHITAAEYSTLESYLSSDGNLLVTE